MLIFRVDADKFKECQKLLVIPGLSIRNKNFLVINDKILHSFIHKLSRGMVDSMVSAMLVVLKKLVNDGYAKLVHSNKVDFDITDLFFQQSLINYFKNDNGFYYFSIDTYFDESFVKGFRVGLSSGLDKLFKNVCASKVGNDFVDDNFLSTIKIFTVKTMGQVVYYPVKKSGVGVKPLKILINIYLGSPIVLVNLKNFVLNNKFIVNTGYFPVDFTGKMLEMLFGLDSYKFVVDLSNITRLKVPLFSGDVVNNSIEVSLDYNIVRKYYDLLKALLLIHSYRDISFHDVRSHIFINTLGGVSIKYFKETGDNIKSFLNPSVSDVKKYVDDYLSNTITDTFLTYFSMAPHVKVWLDVNLSGNKPLSVFIIAEIIDNDAREDEKIKKIYDGVVFYPNNVFKLKVGDVILKREGSMGVKLLNHEEYVAVFRGIVVGASTVDIIK